MVNLAAVVEQHVRRRPDAEIRETLDWSELRIFDLNVAGKNHGLLLGTKGWPPG